MYPFFVNENVSIRLVQPSDKIELFHVVNRNREYLREWLPWVDSIQTIQDYDTVFTVWEYQYRTNNGFQLVILYEGNIAGMIGLHEIDWSNWSTSIGYWLSKDVQGKGIMTRTVKEIINYCFQFIGINRIEIRCGSSNLKSRAIPEKLGFKQEGIIRDGEWLRDHFQDLIVYAMLKREWNPTY